MFLYVQYSNFKKRDTQTDRQTETEIHRERTNLAGLVNQLTLSPCLPTWDDRPDYYVGAGYLNLSNHAFVTSTLLSPASEMIFIYF